MGNNTIRPDKEPFFAQQPAPPIVPDGWKIDTTVAQLEENFTRAFDNYLGLSPDTRIKTRTPAEIKEILRKIEEDTGIKPALIYVAFVPQKVVTQKVPLANQPNFESKSDDQLVLILVTSEGKSIRWPVEGVTRDQVEDEAELFRRYLTKRRPPDRYLPVAKQLHRWLVDPLKDDLEAQEIENLVFVMDTSLRSLPVAALYDEKLQDEKEFEKGFIVNQYSVGLMPSLSLTDTRYVDVRNLEVLAMGAEEFTELESLPTVSVELDAITAQLWSGKSFLNEDFTLNNLRGARTPQQPFGIVHLSTHASFERGDLGNSYIQLWDSKLRLDQLRKLGLNDPPVELFVLSACRTALGNREAELGFAGLAAKAGVKSALGSLWLVSQEGTLGLMTSFYVKLREAPIKAEALRQAQLSMLNGEVRLENGQLVTDNRSYPLPSQLAEQEDGDLSHPFYWSGFTLIGSPW